MSESSKQAHLRSQPAGYASWIMVFALVVLGVGYLPGPNATVLGEFIYAYSFSILCPLVILAAFLDLDRLRNHAEKVFWRFIAAAFLLWLGADAAGYDSDLSSAHIAGLMSDAFYACFYLLLLLATHRRPDQAASYRRDVELLRDVAGVTLVVAVFVFWSMLSAMLEPGQFEADLPSYALFLVLDLVLMIRLVTLSIVSGQGRWRLIYGLLGLAALLWAVSDLYWLIVIRDALPSDNTPVSDYSVLISFLVVLAATTVRGWTHHGEPPTNKSLLARTSPARPQDATGLVLFYAAVTPATLLVSTACDLTGDAAATPRVALTIAVSLIFAALAGLLMRRLSRGFSGDVEFRLRVSDESVQHSQRMEALGRMAGGIAHDFNNVLTVVLGYAHMIENADDSGSMQRSSAGQIRAAAESARSLTTQLLAFSRKQLMDASVIDIDQLLLETRELLERLVGDEIEVRIITSGTACTVKADAGQITQVLLNLAANAQAAMPQGGELELSVSAVEVGGGDKASSVPEGMYVLIKVSDTGEGMDQATLDHIFEPFYSNKAKGVGLGLAMVYGIVEQSGGLVDVQSTLGEGSTFRIFLPLVERRAEDSAVDISPSAVSGGTETVMLVEDDSRLRRMIASYLDGQGYQVIEAEHGRAAIEKMSSCQQIDLLITDIMMPVMGGRELTQRLAKTHPALPVLAVSGHADDTGDWLTRGPKLEFLQKPFTMDALKNKIRQMLG